MFLSGARNTSILREKLESLQIFFFLTDDSIHKKLFPPHFNPCRSHGNDILCVYAWAVRCPCVRKRLGDDLGAFNTTLLSCSDSSVELSLSPAWRSHLPSSRWLSTRYATSCLFFTPLLPGMYGFPNLCTRIGCIQLHISCLFFSAFATFGLNSIPAILATCHWRSSESSLWFNLSSCLVSLLYQRAKVQSLASKPSTAWCTNYRKGIDKSSGCLWSIWPSVYS